MEVYQDTKIHSLKTNRLGMLFCGADGGKVVINDARSYQRISVLDAHSGALSDMELTSNYLITGGFSLR